MKNPKMIKLMMLKPKNAKDSHYTEFDAALIKMFHTNKQIEHER
jgi:hypothetical protein